MMAIWRENDPPEFERIAWQLYERGITSWL